MTSLTDIEIRALRAMRQFQLAVESIKESDASAARVKQMQRDQKHKPCPGGEEPIMNGSVATCPLCGLEVNGSTWASIDNLRRLMKKPHWIHTEGHSNPFREDGLSGKAAQAADGDWYGSH